jgi:hypothetical protein
VIIAMSTTFADDLAVWRVVVRGTQTEGKAVGGEGSRYAGCSERPVPPNKSLQRTTLSSILWRVVLHLRGVLL